MGLLRLFTGIGSDPAARLDRLDMVQGILVFFTVVCAFQAVHGDLTGHASGRESLTLLAVVVPTLWVYRVRTGLRRQLAASER